jgi:hypothetical protein
MINLRDLRIGNYFHPYQDVNGVILPSTLVMEVEIIDPWRGIYPKKDYCELQDCFFNSTHSTGIELTQKLLLNLGFNIENFILDNYVRLILKFFSRKERFECFVKSDHSETRIKYLHQLQNRFYSMTGLELIDVVAYEYFIKLDLIESKPSFEVFLELISRKSTRLSNFEKMPNYTLGDLPENLFK